MLFDRKTLADMSRYGYALAAPSVKFPVAEQLLGHFAAHPENASRTNIASGHSAASGLESLAGDTEEKSQRHESECGRFGHDADDEIVHRVGVRADRDSLEIAEA